MDHRSSEGDNEKEDHRVEAHNAMQIKVKPPPGCPLGRPPDLSWPPEINSAQKEEYPNQRGIVDNEGPISSSPQVPVQAPRGPHEPSQPALPPDRILVPVL